MVNITPEEFRTIATRFAQRLGYENTGDPHAYMDFVDAFYDHLNGAPNGPSGETFSQSLSDVKFRNALASLGSN